MLPRPLHPNPTGQNQAPTGAGAPQVETLPAPGPGGKTPRPLPQDRFSFLSHPTPCWLVFLSTCLGSSSGPPLHALQPEVVAVEQAPWPGEQAEVGGLG